MKQGTRWQRGWGEPIAQANPSSDGETPQGVYPLDREAFAHGGPTSDELEAEFKGDGVVDLDPGDE